MDGWKLYSEEKPKPWRRVEVDRTQPGAVGHGGQFGLVTDIGDHDLVFRGEQYGAFTFDWSSDRRQGTAHGNYFVPQTKWRYLNDTTEYHNSHSWANALAARPSATLGPLVTNPEDTLLDFETAWNESLYMALVLEFENYLCNEDLEEAWRLYKDAHPFSDCTCAQCDKRAEAFAAIINEFLNEDAVWVCVVCRKPELRDECHTDLNENAVCDNCRSNISSCNRCGDWVADDPYWLYHIHDEGYCESCRDNYFNFCDDCDEWYHPDYDDDHNHEERCDCSPQSLQFQILANSHGVLRQDERLRVELAKGFISDEAIEQVLHRLWYDQLRDHPWPDGAGAGYEELQRAIQAMERIWQAKQGNFTRRLSKLLYQQFAIKLEEGLLSKVGSLVREHSGGSTNEWWIEVTRDLNQGAKAFYNEGSCWWGSEYRSLCALKHWGGFALRSYESEGQGREFPSGRAWVQPVNTGLQPTQDAFAAHAFLVYNGYGNLEGYTAARLVAYLTSRSYRKIGLGIGGQYVNSSSGYLIADQATCDANETVRIRGLDQHEVVAA